MQFWLSSSSFDSREIKKLRYEPIVSLPLKLNGCACRYVWSKNFTNLQRIIYICIHIFPILQKNKHRAQQKVGPIERFILCSIVSYLEWDKINTKTKVIKNVCLKGAKSDHTSKQKNQSPVWLCFIKFSTMDFFYVDVCDFSV